MFMKLTDTFKSLPGIYIMTNIINGKVYVGESINIKNRLRMHRYRDNQVIHAAFQKYGIENFEVYVEYFPSFSKEDLVELEDKLVIKFDCKVPNGYNVCERGNDWTGRKHSKETISKMSKERSGEKHPLFGTKWSKSHLEKKSKLKITDLDNICELYFNQMLSTVEIGKIYNIGHNAVYRYLIRNGKTPRKVNEYIKPRLVTS